MTKLNSLRSNFLRAYHRTARRELAAHLYFVRIPTLMRELRRARIQSGSTGCYFWELRLLHKDVLARRPTAIIEFGSGVSTLVIADALARLQRFGLERQFISMEQDLTYQADLKSWFPKRLTKYVTFLYSPTEDVSHHSGKILRRYCETPDSVFDWIFVDGPNYPDLTYFDGDTLSLNLMQNAVIHIDGRPTTRDVLINELQPRLVRQYSDPQWSTLEI